MSWWNWLTRRRRGAKPADERRAPHRQDDAFPRLYDLRLEERRVLDGMPVAAPPSAPSNDVSIQAGLQADDQAADVFEASAFEQDGESYLQVTVNDQIAYQGKLADIGKLTIHGSGDADKLILDPRAIPLGGLAFDGGGGNDQLVIRSANSPSSAGDPLAASGASADGNQQIALELNQQGGSWQTSLATSGSDAAHATLTGDQSASFTNVEQVIDETAAAVRLVRLADGVDASIANGDSLGWFDVRVDGGVTVTLTADGERLTLATDIAAESTESADAVDSNESPHSVDLVESWQLGDLTFRSADDAAHSPTDSLEVGWRFDVSAGAEDLIAVTGHIDVAAGDVTMSAGQIVVSGSIDAAGGSIRLDGGTTGNVAVTGHVSVASYEAGGVGGSIAIVGSDVRVGPGAIVDASGDAGGGVILLGGDFQGANPDLPNAQLTWLAGTALLSARAVSAGDGGRVIVWSDNVALIHGTIDARGGLLNGDGGFVETSGKGYLEIVRVPLMGPQSGSGQLGMWLIDPKNVVIEAGNVLTDVTVTTPPGGTTYTADTATSKIGVDLLVAAIATNSVVTVQAEDNITVSTPVTFAANTNLFRLLADSDNNGVGTLQIDFAINTGGGKLDLFGGQVLVNATLNADDILIQSPGNVSLNAAVTAGSLNIEAVPGAVTIGAAVQLNGAVGPGAGPDALHVHTTTTTINAGGSITVLAGGANVNVDSNVTLANGVTWTVNTSAANSDVRVSGWIRGNGGSNENLTISSGSGAIQLDGEVGNLAVTQRFGDVALTSTDAVTVGAGVYADSVSLVGPGSTASFSGPINLNGLLSTGTYSLQAAAATIAFGSAANVSVGTGGGQVELNGNVSVADGATLSINTASVNGAVRVSGAIRGDGGSNENLTITAGSGAVRLDGEIGDSAGTKRFGDLAVTSTGAVTIGAGIYGDSFSLTGAASSASITGPINLNGLIGAGPYSLQTAATTISLAAATSITVGAGGGRVELTGNVVIADGASQVIDTSAANGNVRVTGTIRGNGGANENVTITAGSGVVQLDGEIGNISAGQRFGEIAITTTGAVTIGSGAFADSLDIAGPAATATLTGAFNLNGKIGAGPNTLQAAAATIAFGGTSTVIVASGGGGVLLTGNVTLANGSTVTITTSASGGDVHVTGTIRGDGGSNENLTVSTGLGAIQLDGEIGNAAGTQRFGDVSLTSTDSVTVGAGVYADSFAVAGAATTASFGGPINLSGKIGATTKSLSASAATMTFGSSASVTVNTGGGDVELVGDVRLSDGMTLTINTSAVNGNVAVTGSVRGDGGSNENLTINAAGGTVQVTGEVGHATATERFGDVAITSTSNVTLGAGIYADSLAISGPAATVTFGGPLDLNGLIGAGPYSLQASAAAFTLAATTNITIGTGGGDVELVGNVTVADTATFAIDTTAVNGDVHVTGAIRGNGGADENLTVSTGSGGVQIDGEIGNSTASARFGDVAIMTTGAVTLGGGAFADSVDVDGPVTTASLAGAFNLNGLVGAGPNSLQVTAATITLSSNAVVTIGATGGGVTLSGDVTVGNGTTATIDSSAANGDVLITNTVRGDGGGNDHLTISSGTGAVQIDGEIGNAAGTQRFGDLSITSTGTVTLGAGVYADSLNVAGPASSISFAGPLQLNGQIISGTLALQAAATTISFAPTSSITVAAGGGGVELLGNVSVANGATLTIDTSAANGGVHVSGTIRGDGGSNENLTVTSGSGGVQLDGGIGQSSAPGQRFGDVSITSTGAVSLSSVFADSLSVVGPAATVSFAGAIDLNGRVGVGPNSLSVAAGTSTFASGANVTVGTGGGQVDVTGNVSIANGSTLTINTSAVNGNVHVSGTIRGDGGANDNLSITTGSGAVALDGEIGKAATTERFGDVLITSTGVVTLGAGVFADSLNVGGPATSATLNGAVNVSGLTGALGSDAVKITATTITFSSGASVTSSAANGHVALTGDVRIADGTSLSITTSAGGGNVAITGTVRGDGGSNENLTISSGAGAVQIGGEIGNATGTQRFGDVSLTTTGAVTLGAGVYADSLKIAGAASSVSFAGPLNLNGQISAGSFALQAAAATISFAAASSVTVGAGGSGVELLGNVSVANGATLTIDTSAANGGVHVSGTIRGDGGSDEHLTVSSGSGAVQLDGEIGKASTPAQRFGDVSITSTGTVALGGGVFADSLSIAGPATSASFTGPINLNGFVAAGPNSLSIVAASSTFGSGANVTIGTGGGRVNVAGDVTIANGSTLTIDTSAVNGQVVVTGTIRGDGGANDHLSITAGSGAVQLGGEIGNAAATSRFGDVAVTSTGAVTLGAGVFADSLSIGGAAASATLNGAVNLSGLIGAGPNSLQVAATTITFNSGASVTTSAPGGDVTLTGNVSLANGVSLVVDTSAGNGDVLVTGTLRGNGGSNETLTVSSGSGTVQINGEIGDAVATQRFGDVVITSTSTVSFGAGVYADSLSAPGPGSAATFTGPIDLNGLIAAGPFALRVVASTISFASASNVTIGSDGGDVELLGNVSVANGATLSINTSAANGDVHVSGMIRGNGGSDEHLTVTSGTGTVQLDGEIGDAGATQRFGDVAIVSSGAVSLGSVYGDSLSVTGPATTVTLNGPINVSGLVSTGIYAVQIVSAAVVYGNAASITVAAGGGDVDITGTPTLANGATLTIDTSAVNGDVHLTDPIRGDGGSNENLVITAGSGAVQLDGEIGDATGLSRFGDVTITSTGPVTFNSGVYADALKIAGPAATVTFVGAINLNGLVGIGPDSLQVAATTIAFGAGSSVTIGSGGGDVTLSGNVTVANGATLSINTSAANGDLHITGTVRGDGGSNDNLTVNAGSGTVAVDGEVGHASGTSRFGDVAITTTGAVSFGAGLYADSLLVTGPATSASLVGSVNLNGLVGAGPYSLQLTAATISFGTTSSVTIGGGGGDVELSGNVSLANGTALSIDTSAVNGDVHVTGTIRGNGGSDENLTVSAGSGAVQLDGAIGGPGATGRFGDVALSSTGPVTLGAGVIADSLRVSGPATTATLAGPIDLNGRIGVGTDSLEVTSTTIQLGLGANVTIGSGGGNVTLTGEVMLQDGAGLTFNTSAANGEVRVTGTLRGDGGANEHLAIFTGSGDVQLDGEVGNASGGQRFGDLAITSTGAVALGAGVFGDSLQVAGPATTAMLTGPVNVNGLIGAGPNSVQVTAGTIAFGSGSSVTVGAGGGDVQLAGNVSVANGSTLAINTQAASGDVQVTGTIRGNGGSDENLQINSGAGVVVMSGEIGDSAATARFGDVSIASTSAVSLGGGVYADSLSVTGPATTASLTGPLDLTGLIGAGPYSLHVSANAIAFGAGSGVTIGAGGGDVELNGNVSVASSATLTIDSSAANGDVHVVGSIRGNGGANENLSVSSGSGRVMLDGEIGDAAGASRFGDVTVIASSDVTFGAAGVYADSLVVNGPAGAVRLIGTLNLASGLSVVGQSLAADAGISTFGGGVGGGVTVTALATGPGPSIVLHQVNVNGSDVRLTSAGDVRFLGGDDSIRSTGGGGQFVLQPTDPSLTLGIGDETMGAVGISATSLDAIGVGFTDGIVFGATGQTGQITVFGAQRYHDSVTLRADGGADIDFNASLDLTEDGATGADFKIQGQAGGANPTRIEWFGNVTTNQGAVTFIAESLRLRGPATSRIATGGGMIDFSAMSRIDGDASHPAFELDTSGAPTGAPIMLPDVVATSGGLSRLSINTAGTTTGGNVLLNDVTLVAVTPGVDPALLEIHSGGVTTGDVQFGGRVDVEGAILLNGVGDVSIADTLIADTDVAIVGAKGDVTGTPGGNIDIVSPQLSIDTAGSVGGASPLETSTQRLAAFADGVQGIKIDNLSSSPATVVALVASPNAPVVLQQTGGGALTLGDPAFAPISQISGRSVNVTTDGNLAVVQEVETFGTGATVLALQANGDVLLGDGGRAITHPENSGIAVDAGGNLTVTPGFLFEVGVNDADTATRFNEIPPMVVARPVEVSPGVDVTTDGEAAVQLVFGDPSATLQEQNFRVAVDWAFGRGQVPPLVAYSYQFPNLNSPTGLPFNSSYVGGSPTLIVVDYDEYPGPDPTQPIPVSITVSIDPRVQLTSAGASLDTSTTQFVLLRTSGQAFALAAAATSSPPNVPYVIPTRAVQMAWPLVSPSSSGSGNIEFETIEMTTSEAQLRQFVLRVVEDVDENQRPLRMSDDIPLPPEVMDKLLDFFAKLPDDRYRIYLISEDGTRQLVKDFVIRRGKAIDLEDLLDAPAAGDERERTPDAKGVPGVEAGPDVPATPKGHATPQGTATPPSNDGATLESYRLDQPLSASHVWDSRPWPAELQAELDSLAATSAAAITGGTITGGTITGGAGTSAAGTGAMSDANETTTDGADWSDRVRDTLRQDMPAEWLRLRRLMRNTKGMGAE